MDDQVLAGMMSVARNSIEAKLKLSDPKTFDGPPESLGVFVTLLKDETLRGCMGHLEPHCANLVEEVQSCALAAAFRDPRFEPLTAGEWAAVEMELSFLSPSEPVDSVAELDPEQYGVIVESDGRVGTLLPGIEGIDDAERQVAIAMRKAGIEPHEAVNLHRYLVRKVR